MPRRRSTRRRGVYKLLCGHTQKARGLYNACGSWRVCYLRVFGLCSCGARFAWHRMWPLHVCDARPTEPCDGRYEVLMASCALDRVRMCAVLVWLCGL